MHNGNHQSIATAREGESHPPRPQGAEENIQQVQGGLHWKYVMIFVQPHSLPHKLQHRKSKNSP